MGYLKEKSALMLYDKHPELGSEFNKTFWARGYYVATVGNITDNALRIISKNSQKSPGKKIPREPLFSGSQ